MESSLTEGLSFVETTMNGYLKPETPYGGKGQENWKVYVNVTGKADDKKIKDQISEDMKDDTYKIKDQKVKVYNARELQAKYNSPYEMFKTYGFCLLNSPTKVKNWNENYFNPFTDINKFYHQETKDNLNKVFDIDNQKDIEFFEVTQNNAVLRRGPGSKNNFYA